MPPFRDKKRMIRDLFRIWASFVFARRRRGLLYQPVNRNIRSRYRGLMPGQAWSFIRPLLTLCICAIVFSIVCKAKFGGIPHDHRMAFAVILFSGLAAFAVFADSLNGFCCLIFSNVKRAVFPLELLPVSRTTVNWEGTAAAKSDALTGDRERSVLFCRSPEDKKKAIRAVRETLNSECDNLCRNQEAQSADRETVHRLLVRKNEVEQESCERLRSLELLRELYASLLQILWQREQVIRDLAAVREKFRQALEQLIVRRSAAECTVEALREARRGRGAVEAAARRDQEVLREETYARRDAAVRSAMRNWAGTLRRLTLLKPFLRGVGLLRLRYRGACERWLVRRSALFDPVWYRMRYPETAGRDPARDYLETGWREGRDPSLWFSSRDYLDAHPEAGGNPLVHFLTQGWRQFGLVLPRPLCSPEECKLLADSPLWDEAWYRERYPDLEQCSDLLKHYLTKGWREGRTPSPWFDPDFYCRNCPDVTGNPLVHYLAYGQFEGRSPQELNWPEVGLEVTAAGLFRPDWYRARHSEIGAADPWTHFVAAGCAAGFDPSPEFSLTLYRELNPDVQDANPLIHYWLHGREEQRRYRLKDDSDREMVEQSGLFDPAWYLEHNSDVAQA